VQKPDLKEAQKRSKKKPKIITDFIIDENLINLGLSKKYFVKTYGCQMNEHDSEKIKAMLEKMNYQATSNMEEADVIVLNSCSIRENAHNKVFGMIGQLKKLKDKNEDLILVLCGCMAQEEIVVAKILEKYYWLDIVFGTHNINNFPNLLGQKIFAKKQQIEVFSKEGEIYEGLPIKRKFPHKAWVNIMLGCDKFCAYCIVPYTRGKQRSRKRKYILNEIKDLIANGCQEITLLGQNVNAYGKDLADNYYFADLLNDIGKLNMPRVRFMTNHPWDFNDEIIFAIQKNKNIMPHIHLPLQSGSDQVLQKMNRGYCQEEYIALYFKLKKAIPNICISTDIIVGFPTESEEDFQETLKVVNKCQFDYAFTFIYSKRVGTPAAKLEDKIPLAEKEKRLQKLNKYISSYALESNQRFKSKEVKVLVDGFSEKNKQVLTGYSEHMKRVNFYGAEELIGRIVLVKITDVKTWSLFGVLSDEWC